ncbi:2'-5' RNA ligase family protein [Nocardioides sp. SYSU DS0663]|uniref:2'-5' RNA ligase family protein n=1 Tax=Nocardioides sp. SYSU DS0663 TaxID=3416445 RepID=UPI003F4C8904
MSGPNTSMVPRGEPRGSASRLFSGADHGRWRPEWTPERPCLYWYLTFDVADVHRFRPPALVEALARRPWLDVVPPRWWHMTLCDVGFAEAVGDAAVDAVVASVGDLVRPSEPLNLELGPAVALRSAVTLAGGPFGRVRDLQRSVRHATEEVTQPDRSPAHPLEFWPHVSLGYANTDVPGHEVLDLLAELGGAGGTVPVAALTLARVVRRGGHYEWTVVSEVPLGDDRSARGVSAGTARPAW